MSGASEPALRCPRCGTWLGARASAALLAQRRARADGGAVAVGDDAPFCGCCGLLVATPVAARAAVPAVDTTVER